MSSVEDEVVRLVEKSVAGTIESISTYVEQNLVEAYRQKALNSVSNDKQLEQLTSLIKQLISAGAMRSSKTLEREIRTNLFKKEK